MGTLHGVLKYWRGLCKKQSYTSQIKNSTWYYVPGANSPTLRYSCRSITRIPKTDLSFLASKFLSRHPVCRGLRTMGLNTARTWHQLSVYLRLYPNYFDHGCNCRRQADMASSALHFFRSQIYSSTTTYLCFGSAVVFECPLSQVASSTSKSVQGHVHVNIFC